MSATPTGPEWPAAIVVDDQEWFHPMDLVHMTEIAEAAGYAPLSTLWTWVSRHGQEGGPFAPVRRGSPPIFSWSQVGEWVCDRMGVDHAEVTARLRAKAR